MENQDFQNQGFNFNKFIEDSKTALLSPQEYFANMPTKGGFGEPIIKALIYAAIGGVFTFLWTSVGMQFATGSSWLGGGIGVMAFIGSLIAGIIGLFIGAVIMLIISSILGGSNDFESNLRVVASLMVVGVLSNLFNFFDSINLYLSAFVSIAFSLWSLWMTYHALVQTLKAKESGSKVLMIVLAVLMVIATFTGIAAKKAVQSISENYGFENFDEMSDIERQTAVLKSLEKISDGEINADEVGDAMKVLNNTFAYEMADGTEGLIMPEESMKVLVSTLNTDNDFIIINSVGGFVQAAINDDGTFTVEYKDETGHFSSTEMLDQSTTAEIFTKYIHKDETYKDVCEWEDFE